MSSLNKVFLIGNLGKDPEIKLSNNIKIAKINIATAIKKQDGTEETEWHHCTLFDRLADVAETYLKKGNKVYVEGRIRSTRYTDDIGVERIRYEIVISNLVMLGNRGDNQQPADNQGYNGGGYNSYGHHKPSTGFGNQNSGGFNSSPFGAK